ncbi:MAG: U32 family peptidase [Clostridia bacterium]|nr:U32 family peptidase [Clostridia bacterium]
MELLAPAGNMECLKTAVKYGTDAVYFAGKQFGARSFADNFSEEELREAVSYCRLRGVKTYVTVNTMTLDREYEELDSLIALLADAGVDGVIVQDMGVLRRIRQICPDLPIHASTQMTVHNLSGVKMLESLGVQRVVLARELSAEEIGYIAHNCQAELEVFVHGAMCMSYSGQCLMSSVLGGRSGNRGKCAQPCRQPYQGKNGNEKFFLSLKDMCLMRHLKTLEELGIASLKIEGRMKGPAYVAEVVAAYRRCIDENRQPTKEEETRLNRVFYRGGLTDGYWKNQKGKEMFAFDKPDNPYAKGGEMEMPHAEERQTKVVCKVWLKEGERPRLSLKAMGEQIEVVGEEPLPRAEKNPATKDGVVGQISKTGGTAFVFSLIEVEVAGRPFAPVKMLNQLRRDGIAKLEEAIQKDAKKPFVSLPQESFPNQKQEMQLTASVRTAEQFDAIKDFPFGYIDLPLSVLIKAPENYLAEKERVVVAPPVIVTDDGQQKVWGQLQQLSEMGFTHLRAENIHWLSQKNWKLHGGHRLNVASSSAVRQWEEMGIDTLCLSAELNLAQVRDIQKSIPLELLIYGHLPLMITENCVLKNQDSCTCSGNGTLTDRKGTVFPVIKDDDVCRSVILNSVPLFAADKLADVTKTGIAYGRLLFTVEEPEQCREIAAQYFGKAPVSVPEEYTRLHFYKGVL